MTTRQIIGEGHDIVSRELNQALGLLDYAGIDYQYKESLVPDIEDSIIELSDGHCIAVAEGGYSSALYFETKGILEEIRSSYSLIDLVKYYLNHVIN